MKTSILISLASLIGLGAYAQTGSDKMADDNTVIVIVNNYDNDDEKAKKEKEEKDKKDKEEKEKKAKKEKGDNDDDDNNGNGNNGNGNSGNGKGNGSPVLGLEDVNISNTASVYPNPATDQLFIANIPANANTYVLLNMDGGNPIKGPLNSSQVNLNVKNYPKGIYTIQLLDHNQAVIYKNRVVISN